MRRLAGAAAVLTLVVGTAASAAAPDFSSLLLQDYTPPKPAPDFSLPDLNGKTRTLAEFRGKVLMLFFWATW